LSLKGTQLITKFNKVKAEFLEASSEQKLHVDNEASVKNSERS
jgi:hypothetical protein